MKSDININNKDCLLNWKEFEISRLFTIKSPAARTIKSYSEGKTPYVSSGSFNNGIVSYLEPMADEKIEKGQCITVSPLDGSAFFQEEDFLGRGGAGSAISLLYNLNLTRYNALFICTIIKIMAEKFGYNDALTSDNLRKLTVSSQSAKKIRDDILSCYDKSKLLLPKDKIKKIICGYCSTNIHIEQFDSIMGTIEGVEIELIGIDTLSHDLAFLYPHIAKDELGIEIDTNQFFEVEDFVKSYDANGINAPINCDFLHRESEFTETCTSIINNKVTILTGASGIGKTRLALEVCRQQDNGKTKVFCVKSNGNFLYEDIKYYISDSGKYLIFFDDVNMVVQIVEYALKTEISFTEEIRNSRSVNFVRMTLGFTAELADIRTQIWKNLAILRKNEEYDNTINSILSEVHFNGLDEEDTKNYLQTDFNTIYECVIDRNTPNFFDAKVVARYKKEAERLGIKIDERYMIAARNPEFRIYRMLTREHLIGRTIEEDERLRKEAISKEISVYDLKDFKELFSVCKFLEKAVCDREQWNLNAGLNCVFEIIEGDTELYLEVLKSYFDAKAPFSLNGYRQIKYLLDHIGYEATYCFINNEVFAKKDEWMAFIWECMPEETIDEKIINDYKTFVFNNLAKDKPIVPAVQVVARYCERDSKLKAVVIKAVLTNPQMSANFLSYVYDDVAVEGIINFFENDIIALASIYMSAIENNCHIDYDGKLFKRIFEQHPTVWNEYVDWIKSKDTMCGDGNEHKIIELIWGDDKWRECVEYAFKVLIDDDVIFHIKEPADMLFTNTTDETILERKKYWLIEKLRETSLELKKCKKLIEMVVNVLPDWKLEYILEFLKINKNPEDFKEIPLFPSSYSWSGSEIPLIMEKIDFLKSLKDNIKGINFIEHRKYIEEYRMNLERYKDNVELREYLENADYA